MSFEPMTQCGACSRWLHPGVTRCPVCDARADRAHHEALSRALIESLSALQPVPMQLTCPNCGMPHIDRDEWARRPHKTHLCFTCKHEWRPFDYPTVGIDHTQEPV